MRRRPLLLAFILSLVLMWLVVPPATPSWGASRVAQFTIGGTMYTVNGQPFFMDVAPYIKNGRTYLPVRYMAYALGVSEGNIFYSDGVVTLVKDNRVVQITIGSKVLVVNGVTTTMDVAPVTKNGRTMLPLRWLAQAFGAAVDWDLVYQKVTVSLVTAEPISRTSTSYVASQTQVPQSPSGLYLAGISSGSANSSYQVTLQWNSVTGTTGYRVYARASYWDRFYYLTETAVTNYTTTASMNRDDYWQFYVTAVNSAGESSASNVITVTPPETSITDDFNRESGLWQYYGSAYRDPETGYVVLTPAATRKVGVLWLRQEITMPFTVEFRYWAGGGHSGLTFMFYKRKDYTPDYGAYLGFSRPGYAVEFDRYKSGSSDPAAPHIALIKDSTENHLYYVQNSRAGDGQWHQVKVQVYERVVIVYVDGVQVIKWGGDIERKYGGLGFSA